MSRNEAAKDQSKTTVTGSARNNTTGDPIMSAPLATTQRANGSPKNTELPQQLQSQLQAPTGLPGGAPS